MAELTLSDGSVAFIDDEDMERISKRKWRVNKSKRHKTVYVVSDICVGRKAWRVIYLHREVLGLSNEGNPVDHIDHDGRNNRKSNLRVVTPQENNLNASIRSDNTSGYKGVTYEPRRRHWVANIGRGGRNKYLGKYPTPEDAARAYNAAAAEIHGEYAYLNRIPGDDP